MIKFSTHVSQCGFNIFFFEIGKFFNDLFLVKTGSKQVYNVSYTYPHSPDARAASALLRIDCNAILPGIDIHSRVFYSKDTKYAFMYAKSLLIHITATAHFILNI